MAAPSNTPPKMMPDEKASAMPSTSSRKTCLGLGLGSGIGIGLGFGLGLGLGLG